MLPSPSLQSCPPDTTSWQSTCDLETKRGNQPARHTERRSRVVASFYLQASLWPRCCRRLNGHSPGPECDRDSDRGSDLEEMAGSLHVMGTRYARCARCPWLADCHRPRCFCSQRTAFGPFWASPEGSGERQGPVSEPPQHHHPAPTPLKNARALKLWALLCSACMETRSSGSHHGELDGMPGPPVNHLARDLARSKRLTLMADLEK